MSPRSKAKDLPLFALRTFDLIGQPVKNRQHQPVVRFAVRFRWWVICLATLSLIGTVPVFWKLGNEFMPPLNEGAILYMPTTLPGISITEAGRVLQIMDRELKTFPEVERVFGKIGRSTSSTDMAPLSITSISATHATSATIPKR